MQTGSSPTRDLTAPDLPPPQATEADPVPATKVGLDDIGVPVTLDATDVDPAGGSPSSLQISALKVRIRREGETQSGDAARGRRHPGFRLSSRCLREQLPKCRQISAGRLHRPSGWASRRRIDWIGRLCRLSHTITSESTCLRPQTCPTIVPSTRFNLMQHEENPPMSQTAIALHAHFKSPRSLDEVVGVQRVKTLREDES